MAPSGRSREIGWMRLARPAAGPDGSILPGLTRETAKIEFVKDLSGQLGKPVYDAGSNMRSTPRSCWTRNCWRTATN